jgi:hypothetical protein
MGLFYTPLHEFSAVARVLVRALIADMCRCAQRSVEFTELQTVQRTHAKAV